MPPLRWGWVLVVVWAVRGDEEGARTRQCDEGALRRCRGAYDRCLVQSPAGDYPLGLVCACSDEYYGVCARAAGCASALMRQCVDHNFENTCGDSSVCGSNCIGDGEARITDEARFLTVNNFGANALRFSVCAKRHNDRALDRFSTVTMERCDGDLFHECPYWIPPRTFTAIAIARNASYLKMEFCVFRVETGHFRCLEDPRPKEFYGTPLFWPSSVDVDFAEAPWCHDDDDCPGTFCDKVHVPAVCSPKILAQFRGPADKFKLTPRDELPLPEL